MKFDEAQLLVKQPKWVVDGQGIKIETLKMEKKFPMRFRLHLVGSLDQKQEFLLDVKQSEKFGIKLNFQISAQSDEGFSPKAVKTIMENLNAHDIKDRGYFD